MKVNKNFIGSRMNKSLDERLLKPGEYIDAMNIRISSPEGAEAGSAENAKGTEKLTTLTHNGLPLSNPVCIGAFEDGERETIYWFVTSDNVDMIVSYNENTSLLVKHVVSTTVLNFSSQNLVNGINLVDDLLFFTDNFNQPRKINVTRTYPVPVSGVDQITEDDISVIVKPPVESPSLTLSLNNTKENYLEDRFIRFAYRYKYIDGEYSALSEFSDLGFNPVGFRLDFGTFDNIGMLNRFNEALVTINTGSKNVVGVDICFKQSNSNTVNVIERFNKADQGWADNMLYTLTFNNQKIYTALQDSEILRLFDNVPKRAKTQTSIGNRIIYGNYVDGYDIDTTIRMTAFGISEDATDDFIQTVDEDTYFQLLLQDTELLEGKTISLNLNLVSQGFTGATYPGNENDYNDSWAFTLLRDYDDAADLATSQEFIDAIVLGDTFATADQGYSMTDRFFASIVAQSPFDKIATVDSNNVDNTGFAISYTTHTITITIPGVKYEDPANPGAFAYETFHISSPQATIFSDDQRRSFHSNRDYEVGIEYLDEYGRASTALVSENNTVFFDASKSTKQNKIRVQLDHLAPSWASRYRFVVKPSKTDYETIYSTFWIPLNQDASYWIRLEGDNQTKAKVGDLLIVKKYGEAAASSLVKTKILDLKVQSQGFISGDANDDTEPTGLYMRIKPSGFAIQELDDDDIFDKFDSTKTSGGLHFCVSEANPDYGTPGELEFQPIAIPAGTRIELMFRSFRFGSYDYDYAWKETYISNYDFDSLYDFMKNTNIDFSDPYIDSGYLGGPVGGNSTGANHITFVESLGNGNDVILGGFGVSSTLSSTTGISHGKYSRVTDPAGENVEREMKVRFYEDPATGRLWITSDSMNNGTGRRPNRNEMGVTIIKGGDPLVFETEPLDNDNEIYYQSHKSYPIVNRNHTGNVTNQNSSLGIGAVVDLEMFDCFSFGNGVESYKVRDGLAKPGFKLGARVTSVSEQDYKEAHRHADVTYSGVYNEETNIKKLNEFNLGLANFKTLEQSFGPINVLHGRQTDILVLQEDKVSYVLAGKNILSDAVGGGTLVSVPEVLGQQVSRVEEYGCSDIESFASYGGNVFFTDEKRGAVINLKGGNRSEQLNVISSLGMRSWFRDRFIENKNNIKLGCYDPYMGEYVLTFTDSTFTQGLDTLECGTQITQYESSTATTFNVDLGSSIGTSTITYNVSQGSAVISVVYASSTVVNQTITGSGTIDFVKSDIETELCTVTITPTNATFSLSVGCITDESLTIFRIVKNTGDMAGLTATPASRWVSPGPFSTITPPITIPVTFLQGPVSQWHESVGLAGYGQFPTDGSTIRMRHIGGGGTAEWEFDRFKYLVSDTLYTQDEIETLMPLLNTAGEIETSITAIPGDTYEAEFTYSNPNGHRYLYLVWDYVEPEIECNAVSSTYNVDSIGKYDTIVNMPNVIGDVTFTFDVGNKPARIYLTYLGDIVADSLFIGDDLPDATLESEITSFTGTIQAYDYIGNGQFGETYIVPNAGFISSDIAVSDGSETRANGSGTGQIGVVADYPSSTALASDGQIKLTFFKNATTDIDNPYEPANQVKVVIYSVNSGANTWNMTTGCPVELPDSSQPDVTDFVCSNTTVNSGNNGKVLYNIDAEVGTGEGAVVVTVRPDSYNRELAMKAEKGSQVYNDVVSSFDGFHSASNYNDYTAVGNNTLSNTSAPELVWDGSAFTATGNTEPVTLQSSLSSFPPACANAPTYTMVIPKTETDVTSINLKVLAFDDVNITVKCPTYLTGVRVHGPYGSPVDAVNGNTATFFAYKTNVGSKLGYTFNGNANNILHNEQLFTDPFGQSKLDSGWYYTEFIWKDTIWGAGSNLNSVFYVDNNGVTQYYDDDGSPCGQIVLP